MWQVSIAAVCYTHYSYSLVMNRFTDLSTLRTPKYRAYHQQPLYLHCVKFKQMDKFKYLETITQMLPPSYKDCNSHWRFDSRDPRCQSVLWSQLYSDYRAASVGFQYWSVLLFLLKQTFYVLEIQEIFQRNPSIQNINIRNKHHLHIIPYNIMAYHSQYKCPPLVFKKVHSMLT